MHSWDGGTLNALAAVVARKGSGDKTRNTYGTASLEARTPVDKGTRRDRDRQSRQFGEQRTRQMQRSWDGMQHQLGGGRMGGFRRR